METILRVAEKKDIDDLYLIFSHESVSPNMGFDPCSRIEFEEIFYELTSGGELIIEENDQGVVAACKVARRARRLRHSAYIGSLAVRSSLQGEGLGRIFLGNIISSLKNEGLTRLELLVAADNLKAIGLFASFGFLVEGTHKNYFSRAGSDLLFNEHTMAWVQDT